MIINITISDGYSRFPYRHQQQGFWFSLLLHPTIPCNDACNHAI